MSKQIKVMLIKPGDEPIVMKVNNELESFQLLVDGYIEITNINEKFIAIVNENGRLENLDPCIETNYDMLVGNVIICRTVGERFAGLQSGDEEKIQNLITLL